MPFTTNQSDPHPDPLSHPSPYRNQLNSSVISLNPSPSSPLKNSVNPFNSPTVDFDEGVLRTLCGLECGFPLLVDRLKQAVGTSREVGLFLKKKSQLEEEYGVKLAKLAKERLDAYTHLGGEVKAGSFGREYCTFLSTHERMGIERTEYSARLNTIADDLVNLGKEVERIRKANKDVGWRLEKNLTDSQVLTEKAKAKFDVTVEELERVLISKQAENAATSGSTTANLSYSSSSSSGQPKSVAQAKALGKAISKFAVKGTRSAAHLAKLEDEVRGRMSAVSDVYRTQVLATQQVRHEYFNLQLPKILRTLKEHSDETDLAIQYFLANYSSLSESLLVSEALSISALPTEQGRASIDKSNSGEVDNPRAPPSTACGLKDIIQSIDNRADFKEFMANYAAHFNQTHHAQLAPQVSLSHPSASAPAHPSTSSQTSLLGSTGIQSGSFPGTHQPYQHSMKIGNQQLTGESPRTSTSSNVLGSESKKTFGVDLATQMMRDGIETVPKVVEKCVEAIEKAAGIEMVGIYRLSGTTSKIGRLKQRFDADVDSVILDVGAENQSEINDIAGTMKLWLRELPEPLLTWNLYASFIEAGRIENNRLRHIRLHERVNELPDPNYATLKYLMGHLDKVRRNESINSMGASNLAVIFGPTLLSPPPMNFYHHQQQQHQSNDPLFQQNLMNNHNHSNNINRNHNNWGANLSSSSVLNNGHVTPPAHGNNALQDMSIQCKVVETILEHYREIFVDEGEEEGADGEGDAIITAGEGHNTTPSASSTNHTQSIEEESCPIPAPSVAPLKNSNDEHSNGRHSIHSGARQSLTCVPTNTSIGSSHSSFDLQHLSIDSRPSPSVS